MEMKSSITGGAPTAQGIRACLTLLRRVAWAAFHYYPGHARQAMTLRRLRNAPEVWRKGINTLCNGWEGIGRNRRPVVGWKAAWGWQVPRTALLLPGGHPPFPYRWPGNNLLI